MARIYRATLFRIILKIADRIIVVSDYWEDHIASIVPSARERLRVVRTGVDLQRFSIGTGGDGTELLFVGILDKFHRYKGLDDLLNAVALLERPFQLSVVGDGSLRADYQQLADRLGIADKVRFHGHLDSRSLLEAYQTSDIYVLPSKVMGQEGGFTLTALEAMATGRPVILAEGVGQLAREVDAVGAGVRVPAENATALASAVDQLLRDEGQRLRMGIAARAYVENHHSWDVIAEQRRAIYLEAAGLAENRRMRRAAVFPFRGPSMPDAQKRYPRKHAKVTPTDKWRLRLIVAGPDRVATRMGECELFGHGCPGSVLRLGVALKHIADEVSCTKDV